MNRLTARRNRRGYLAGSFPSLQVGDRVAFSAESEWELVGRVIEVRGQRSEVSATVETMDNSSVPPDLRHLGWHAIGSHRTVEWGGGLKALLLEDGSRQEPIKRQPVQNRQSRRFPSSEGILPIVHHNV